MAHSSVHSTDIWYTAHRVKHTAHSSAGTAICMKTCPYRTTTIWVSELKLV